MSNRVGSSVRVASHLFADGHSPALPNLLDYVENRRSSNSAEEHGRGLSPDFLHDLGFATARGVNWVRRLTATARLKEDLFTALDGQTAADRTPMSRLEMLRLVSDMVEGPSRLVFIPSVSGGGIPSHFAIEAECACAVSLDGSRAFVSTSLGFRSLFLVSQAALLQALILRGRAAGMSIPPRQAFGALCKLPDCELDPTSRPADFVSSRVQADGGWTTAVLTFGHRCLE